MTQPPDEDWWSRLSDSGIPSVLEIKYIRELVEEKVLSIRQLFDEKLNVIRTQIEERDKALDHQFSENQSHFERLNHAAQQQALDRGELVSRRDHDHVHNELNNKNEAKFRELDAKVEARLKLLELSAAEARGKADKSTALWAFGLGALGTVVAIGSLLVSLIKLFVQ